MTQSCRTLIALVTTTLLAFGASADDTRKPHYLTKPPAEAPVRIVSLAPVTTEILFALGVGDRVVGVTRFCDRPQAATTKPKVGGYIDVSLERVLAQRPDLVVGMPSMGQRALLTQLQAQGVPIYVGFGDALHEVRDLIRGLGDVVGRKRQASQLLDDLDAGLRAAHTHQASRKRVVVLVGSAPIVAAGPNTFIDDVVHQLGHDNALRTGGSWPVLSLESLLSLRPDVVVVASGAADAEVLQKQVQHNKLDIDIRVAPSPLLMRPGPTLHVDAAAFARLVAAPKAPAP